MHHVLLLFLFPIIASAFIFLLSSLSSQRLKPIALLLSLVPLFLLLYRHEAWTGLHINYNWIPQLSIRFHLSIDSISLLFLYLTSIIIPLAILISPRTSHPYPQAYYGLILLLQGLIIGFFTARDLVLFTFFYEAMLIPVYFLIVEWGGPLRLSAGLKFLVYMVAGSALLIAAILGLYTASTLTGHSGVGTFDIDYLTQIASTLPHANVLCAIFLLAFAVKTPLFPFHAWLPDAYCQASTPVTILLSALLSKAGIYGFLRVALPLFPDTILTWAPWLLALSVTGVFYGALEAWKQNDFKRLVSYSSFSHVNFILVGLFALSQTAETGAILQAFNHGITIAALFMVAGWLEERLHTTQMESFGGLAVYFPHLCWITLFFVLASVALPGTNNFVGEIIIFFGLFGKNPWLAAFLALSVIISVVYMLRWMQTLYFGPSVTAQVGWIDIGWKKILVSLPLILIVLWVGIYPAPILENLKPAVTKLLSSSNKEPQP